MNCDALGYDKQVGDEEWGKILAGRAARGEGQLVPCPGAANCPAWAHRHVALAHGTVIERLFD